MPKLVKLPDDVTSIGNKRKFKLPSRLQPIIRTKELNHQVDATATLAMRNSVSPRMYTEDNHSAAASYWPGFRDMNSEMGDAISHFHGSVHSTEVDSQLM